MNVDVKSKYLLRKASGSKARYTRKPDYSEKRGRIKEFGTELPYREKMKRKGHTYLDTSLVKRWLFSQVGKNFDGVYSEFLMRLQPKYRSDYQDSIYYYTIKASDVVLTDSKEILQKSQYGGHVVKVYPRSTPFYICPKTNILKRVKI